MELAGGFIPFWPWIPTERNPADRPSSKFGIRARGGEGRGMVGPMNAPVPQEVVEVPLGRETEVAGPEEVTVPGVPFELELLLPVLEDVAYLFLHLC